MRRTKDELSELIDEIENDDTLHRKMAAFKAKKDRKSRLEKNKKKAEAVVIETPAEPVKKPIVLQREDTQSELGKTKVMGATVVPAEESAGKTAVFDPGEIEEKKTTQNQTVVLDDQEIQTLLEEDEDTPVIQRKIIHKKKASTNKQASGSFQKVLVAALSVVLLVALMGGLFYLINNGTLFGERTEEVETQEYKELLEWAESYNTLSESEKDRIIEFESVYNHLSKTQKETIDDTLMERTGKTFNQLLAQAKSSKKKNSKNNNVKSAEEKAKIKDQISSLQQQLAAAQKTYDDASAQIADLQTQIDSLNEDLAKYDMTQLQADVDAATAAYNALGSDNEYGSLEAYPDYIAAMDAYNQQYQAMTAVQSQIDSLTLQQQQYQTNMETAAQSINDYTNQISNLQNELNQYS